MSRARLTFAAVLAPVLLACSPAGAQPSASTATPSDREFRWQRAVAAPRRLEIHDQNGALKLEPARGDTLEIVATKTGRASDLARVNVVVKEVDDTIVVCVMWPDDTECRPGGPRRNGHDRRQSLDAMVDVVARVPAKVAALTARTMNGEIHADALACPANLHTMNGAVQVTSGGPLEAGTMNGPVIARVGGKGHPVRLDTKNGRVELTLPADADADIEASTMNGHLRSAFGPVPAPRFPGVPSSAKLRVGAGGTPMTLRTMNGDVVIHRG